MKDILITLIGLVAILTLLTVGGIVGYEEGLKHNAYQRGVEFGTDSTISTFNDILKRNQYGFYFKYDKDTERFSIVHVQRSYKRNVKREDNITPTE